MPYLYKNTDDFIYYNTPINEKNKASNQNPCIIFHHGLMSGMQSSKAMAIEKYCQGKNYDYIRFDNFGHHSSSGKFEEQTISSWLEGLELIVEKLTNKNQKILLIGSSMGGWIAMLYAIKYPERMAGFISMSAAPDFTEELIWDKLSANQQQQMKENGILNVQGQDPECNYVYPISYKLIEDGRKNSLLNKDAINIKCPSHIIHGMQDTDVPYSLATRIADKISHNNVVVKLIKDANHKLAREKDLHIIFNSIEELYNHYT